MRLLVFAVPFVALGLAACEGCRSTPAPAAAPSGASDVGPPTVRLYLISDLAGALEPCGCTKDQLGGLDHFGAWVRQSRAHVPAALVASAGPLFFMDDRLDPDRADQDRTKAITIARVLRGLDFAAMAPGANDWATGSDGLARLATEAGAVVISSGREAAVPFSSAIVRDVTGIRVAFVGFGQAGGADGSPSVGDLVRRGVEDAKGQGANVIVALAAVGRGEAKRIADAVPELTAVVVGSARANGDANTSAPQAEKVGDVLIVQAANHLQSVAVLDLFVRDPIPPGHVVKFADATGLDLAVRREDLSRRIDDLHVKIAAWERERSVGAADLDARRRDLVKLELERDALDQRPPPVTGSFFRYAVKEMRESLGKDPAVQAQMVSFYKAVDEHNRLAFADRLPPPHGPDQASYVGIEVCSKCHQGPGQVWQRTKHAHAYAALSSQFKEYNLECVGCHVTGYEKPGGSSVTHVAKLENVQCEECHGPGSMHALNPTDVTSIVVKPAPSRCLECHHPPHVEQFDAVARLKEVLGPGHGMPEK
jgi:2',3'-cyclic-nucleotide 2'-phosphodiesterase (5'-nucleotidase family)